MARLGDERGVSLVEVLVAVTLMGLTFTAIVGGLTTSVVGSGIQRQQATADTILRSYGDAVKAAAYVDCARAADYEPADVSYTVSDGFAADATVVRYWHVSQADPDTGTFTGACSSDEGLQRVTVEVSSVGGSITVSRDVFKRSP